VIVFGGGNAASNEPFFNQITINMVECILKIAMELYLFIGSKGIVTIARRIYDSGMHDQ
jgi:lysyl-tRNA synthetase class II